MKPMTQFGAGVYELRDSFDGNAYRVVYVVNLRKALYVLHAFMKKSPPRCLAWVAAWCRLAGRSALPISQRFLGSADGGRFSVPA